MARILIVDDSSYQRRNIRKMVTSVGHEALEAANGQECVELALEQKPDCILLDLLMPEVSGIETLKVLKRLRPSVPVIVITADIQDMIREDCLNLGAANVIHKPVHQGALLAAIASVLSAEKDVPQ